MLRTSLALLLLIGVGCGSKVNQVSTVRVKPGEAQMMIVEAPKKNQRVRVEISAAEPVNVFVILSKDEPNIERDLAKARPNKPASVINGEFKVQTWSGEADIPAGEEYMVWVQAAAKETEVTVKINSL